jgi:hypothetical protein
MALQAGNPMAAVRAVVATSRARVFFMTWVSFEPEMPIWRRHLRAS